MKEQWQELKETIIEMRDNDGTGTQQEVCKFLTNLMDILEEQMQEPCEDTISRQAVLEQTYNWSKDEFLRVTNPFDYLRKRINSLPSANPQEPKTGRWIKYGIPRCGEQHYKCTSCGYYINFGQWGELYTKEFKYCPNCGTRMIELKK